MTLALALLFNIWISHAQGFDDPANPQNATALRQQGQLFTVGLVRGEPIRLFIVGKEEAKIDPRDLKVTVRRLKPYPGKVLALDFKNGYFVPAESNELKDATSLEVTTQSKAKVDKVLFTFENQNPPQGK